MFKHYCYLLKGATINRCAFRYRYILFKHKTCFRYLKLHQNRHGNVTRHVTKTVTVK